jgi:zinc transport system substrate-binding protein
MRLPLTLLLLLLFATPSLAAPKIVVSIAPIHSLVSLLAKGISQPQLLLPPGGSPHSASLRPSQARAMAEADLMIWIGPELESFLRVPVSRLIRPAAVMQLLELEELKRIPQRHGGLWEDEHAEEASHDHQGTNPHIWLSPENARQIVDSIGKRLIRIDPQNSAAYQRNLEELQRRIEQLRQELSAQLAPIRQRPYLVFHDAYPYFENSFSLNAIGSIRISAERAPGARRLQQIRNKISKSAAVCLFTEPQFSPTLAESLAKGSNLKLGELDPLGTVTATGDDGWFQLMRALADNLSECLAE